MIDKTELVQGPGRKAREEIGKRNEMAALRLQTGIREPRPPLGTSEQEHLSVTHPLTTIHLTASDTVDSQQYF